MFLIVFLLLYLLILFFLFVVYDGAPNGKKFGPSKHSMIFAEDYGTPEKLAQYLLYLDKNDTAYL